MLIGGVDAVLVRAPSLDEGLAFYRDALGHALLWRTADAAGLAMGDGGVELVLATGQRPGSDLLVESIEEAMRTFEVSGGSVESGQFEIPVGRGVVVADPFGNKLVLLELSKGSYVTDDEGNVTGVS
jgi:predicted enzyme related to lactoylglutathione lyase